MFFFRKKDVGSIADFTFRQGDRYIGIVPGKLAYDRVYNQIRVEYGSYTAEVNPVTEGDSAPTSWDLYGKNQLNISGGQLFVNTNADIATGTAEAKYNRFKDPKLFFSVRAKMIQQIELSDVIDLELDELAALTTWYWNDSGQYWGKPTIYWGGKIKQDRVTVTCKVIVLHFNIDAFETYVELDEV